jgi:hypothetical protein
VAARRSGRRRARRAVARGTPRRTARAVRRAGGARALRQVEGLGEGQGQDVGSYPLDVRVRTARLREHASAEVDARDPSLAQGLQDPHARTGAAAHVHSPAERPERTKRVGGRVKNALGGAKRRVVELRSEQVVAALDRGQRLDRQFTQRRALRREHRPRVLLGCQTGCQLRDRASQRVSAAIDNTSPPRMRAGGRRLGPAPAAVGSRNTTAEGDAIWSPCCFHNRAPILNMQHVGRLILFCRCVLNHLMAFAAA